MICSHVSLPRVISCGVLLVIGILTCPASQVPKTTAIIKVDKLNEIPQGSKNIQCLFTLLGPRLKGVRPLLMCQENTQLKLDALFPDSNDVVTDDYYTKVELSADQYLRLINPLIENEDNVKDKIDNPLLIRITLVWEKMNRVYIYSSSIKFSKVERFNKLLLVILNNDKMKLQTIYATLIDNLPEFILTKLDR